MLSDCCDETDDGTLLVARGYVTHCLCGPSQSDKTTINLECVPSLPAVLMEIAINHYVNALG